MKADEVVMWKQVAEILYRQVLDSNDWLNIGAIRDGEGLCICAHVHEYVDAHDMEELPPAPIDHDVLCVPFRKAIESFQEAVGDKEEAQ